MKIAHIILAILIGAALSASALFGQVNVQKTSGTNAITGNLVIGDGKTLTATGTGTIIATGGTATSVALGNITGAGTGVLTALAAATNGTGGVVTFGGNIGAASGTSLDLAGTGAMAGLATNSQAVTGTSTSLVPSVASMRAGIAPLRNALAPRQAIVLDGTATLTQPGMSGTMTYGTLAFWLTPTSLASGPYLLSDGPETTRVGFSSSAPYFLTPGGSVSGVVLTAGKPALVAITWAAGTGTVYVDGKAGTPGTVTPNVAAMTTVSPATSRYSGIYSPVSYNYALSATKVLALYETGAPAAEDYNNASNASLITTDQVRNNTGGFFTAPGVLFSGTVMQLDAGEYAYRTGILTVGKKYLAVITIDAITAGSLVVDNGASETFAAYTTTGVKTIEFTPTVNTTLDFYAAGGTVDISNIELYPLGLLCAPESNAPGNGFQWRSASGQSPPADITLPASGVPWTLVDTNPNSVRATLTWAGTHEAKSLLGQVAIPANAVITSIITTASTGSSGSGLTVGSVTTPDLFVAANTYTTAKKVHTLAAQLPAGTATNDLSLVVDPDTANYTGTIQVSINYVLAQ